MHDNQKEKSCKRRKEVSKKFHLHKHNLNLFNVNIIGCFVILNSESKDSSFTNIQATLHLAFQWHRSLILQNSKRNVKMVYISLERFCKPRYISCSNLLNAWMPKTKKKNTQIEFPLMTRLKPKNNFLLSLKQHDTNLFNYIISSNFMPFPLC